MISGNQIFRTEKERRNNAFHLGIGLRIVDLIPILSGFIGSINIFTCGAGNYCSEIFDKKPLRGNPGALIPPISQRSFQSRSRISFSCSLLQRATGG